MTINIKNFHLSTNNDSIFIFKVLVYKLKDILHESENIDILIPLNELLFICAKIFIRFKVYNFCIHNFKKFAFYDPNIPQYS